MGLLDRFKKRSVQEGTDELPDMTVDAGTLASAMKGSPTKKELRAREVAEVAAVAKATTEAENEGLPSVNRRKGGNKMVTVLGFIFIVGAAAAMIVAVNGDKKPKIKKKANEEQVTNNLPPIVIPTAPPPLQIAQGPAAATASPTGSSAPGGQSPSKAGIGAAGSQPIAVHGAATGTQSMGPNGKPALEWWDRKMGGLLTLDNKQQQPAGQPAAARPVAVTDVDAGQAGFGGAGGGRSGGNNELATKLEPTITKGVSASMLPDRNFLITKGTTLDCALETALDSSVPGITTCRLTRDVYSDNGRVLLLDRGSSLVGEYQSGIRQGQVRVFVLWSRAKTPNGVVVSLNSPGTDALGRSGLEGWVDNHFIERFGAAILMSFVKDTVSAMANRSSGGGTSTTNYYGGAATGGEKIIEKILESTVSIPPTIVKNQGDHIQVMVARDLDFSSVYALRAAP